MSSTAQRCPAGLQNFTIDVRAAELALEIPCGTLIARPPARAGAAKPFFLPYLIAHDGTRHVGVLQLCEALGYKSPPLDLYAKLCIHRIALAATLKGTK